MDSCLQWKTGLKNVFRIDALCGRGKPKGDYSQKQTNLFFNVKCSLWQCSLAIDYIVKFKCFFC